MIDWTDAFQNGAYIDDADTILAKFVSDAAIFRAAHANATLGQSYGRDPRHAYDLFSPTNPKGTVIFVHGGYWHQTDRSFWSGLANGCVQNGWSFALPEYRLAPSVRIRDITTDIAAAVTAIARASNGPIRLVGHSAGGHLVSRMNCADVALPEDVVARIDHTVSVSGVHDLRPLVHTDMNTILHLDDDEALNESPAFQSTRPNVSMCFWVGASERPEFLRQNRIIAENWSRAGAKVAEHYAQGENHFTVIEPLTNPTSPLVKEILK